VSSLFGSDEWCDGPGLFKLLFRLLIDLTLLAAIVAIHYRRVRRPDYVFTFGALNAITFAMCFLLRKVPMDLGMGLGLFAVFGILRYRTETLGFRELTYLFVVIGVAVLNATANRSISLAELLAVNACILCTTAALDGTRWSYKETPRPVLYDRLDLLPDDRRAELLEDLSTRLGGRVIRVDVARVDLLRDAAEIVAFIAPAPVGRPSTPDTRVSVPPSRRTVGTPTVAVGSRVALETDGCGA
jgi:hypothetical protein